MECETADYEPGMMPYGPSDVLLALSQSTMVSFHGPETKSDTIRVSQWASVDKMCLLISCDTLTYHKSDDIGQK